MEKMESLFNTLYNKYVNDLYAYGRALGVHREDLQDVIHDVFLHVMERYEQLDLGNKNVKLYLMGGKKQDYIQLSKAKGLLRHRVCERV